jgi:hypothetical protein
MPIVSPPVHFAARYDIDGGCFLFQDSGLRRSELRVQKITFGELTEDDQPIESLVPPGHAIRADDGGRVWFILRHLAVWFPRQIMGYFIGERHLKPKPPLERGDTIKATPWNRNGFRAPVAFYSAHGRISETYGFAGDEPVQARPSDFDNRSIPETAWSCVSAISGSTGPPAWLTYRETTLRPRPLLLRVIKDIIPLIYKTTGSASGSARCFRYMLSCCATFWPLSWRRK